MFTAALVFHMDDFFLRPEQRTEARFAQPGGNVDRERFLEEVLIPLREGRPVDYRRFDCATFTIAPPQRIKAGTLNIVEGAYSMHPDLAPYYDLSGFFCRFRQKNSASASSNGMRPRMQSSFSTAGSLSSSAISTRSMCGTAAISSFRRTIK